MTWLDETLWVGKVLGEDCGLLGDKGMLRVKILASISAMKMKGSSAKGKDPQGQGATQGYSVAQEPGAAWSPGLARSPGPAQGYQFGQSQTPAQEQGFGEDDNRPSKVKSRSRTSQCFMLMNCCGGVTRGGFHRGRSISQIAGPSSGGANSFASFGNDGKHAGAGGASNSVDDEDGDDDDSLKVAIPMGSEVETMLP